MTCFTSLRSRYQKLIFFFLFSIRNLCIICYIGRIFLVFQIDLIQNLLSFSLNFRNALSTLFACSFEAFVFLLQLRKVVCALMLRYNDVQFSCSLLPLNVLNKLNLFLFT